jgi:cytochrome c biogenesis protein CcdA
MQRSLPRCPLLHLGVLCLLGLRAFSEGQEAEPTVYGTFFDSPGCPGCAEGEQIAEQAVEGLAYAELIKLNTEKPGNFELFQVLADRGGLNPATLIVSPSIFVDTDYMDLREHTVGDVRRLIAKYRGIGTGRYWEITDEERANAQTAHVERFQRFTVPAMLLAGLVDGVNPCAFATILFLLSYLAWLGRSRWDILLAGLFFALGIFAPYYLIGAGLLHFSRELTALPVLKYWLFEIVAVAAAAFAIISLMDARKAQAGRPSEMTLKLPGSFRARIHETIKDTTRLGMVGGAFVAGVACALLEAVCTGQIYLPTLVYVAGLGSLRSRAFGYLLLYNLAFVMPIIAISVIAYAGLSSRAIGKFVEGHIAGVKIAMAVVFFVLATLLHFTA